MNPPRIHDPYAVPVAGHDSHLPAIDPSKLTADALRRRFRDARDAAPWQAPIRGDGARITDRTPSAAAVLIGLVERPQGLQVLLTRRTEHLRDHAGQISFPGGRAEEGDDGAEATAIREAAEEVGLPPGNAEVLGRLSDYTTVTHFVVTPVVAIVEPFEFVLDTFEVAEAFEVPLDFLMTPANHRRHVFAYDGGDRQFLSMPWLRQPTEYFIWGATAAMLRNLYHFLER